MDEGVGASLSGFWRDPDGSDPNSHARTLLDSVDDGLFQLDPDGRFVGANAYLTTPVDPTEFIELVGLVQAFWLSASRFPSWDA